MKVGKINKNMNIFILIIIILLNILFFISNFSLIGLAKSSIFIVSFLIWRYLFNQGKSNIFQNVIINLLSLGISFHSLYSIELGSLSLVISSLFLFYSIKK